MSAPIPSLLTPATPPANDAPRHPGQSAAQFAAARDGAVCVPLPGWTAIAVSGGDATAFLQGQFTNDVAGLEPGAAQWNGWCSPKGRLLATFPLARLTGDDYRLLVPADIADSFVRRLRMFVLRTKVVVTPLVSLRLLGAHGVAGDAMPAPGRALAEDGVILFAQPDGRVVALCEPDAAAAQWSAWESLATPAGPAIWDWLGIHAGIPVITTATQDRFVPQSLYWERHGVSFRKGCYPGQEIVARMQYRGRPKERMHRARLAAPAPAPGTSLHSPRFGEQACGTVVNAVGLPDGGSEMLVVVQDASAGVDPIRLSADGPALELLPLPYATRGPADDGPG